MRTRSITFGFAVILALLAAAIWTIAPRERTKSASQPTTAPATAPDTTPAPSDAPQESTPPATGDDALASTEASETDANAAIDVTHPPLPSTRITGRVTDKSGGGIRDAEVRIRSEDAGEFDLERIAELEQSATTDSTGRFEIAGLRAGPVHLEVRSRSWAPAERDDFVLPSAGSIDVGDIALDLPVTLLGRVVDEQGRAIAGALVCARSDASKTSDFSSLDLVRSDADGSFACAPVASGGWTLIAAADGFVETRLSGSALAGQTMSDLVLVLARGGTIVGRVTGSDAAELASLLVVARPLPVWIDEPQAPDAFAKTTTLDERAQLAPLMNGEHRGTVDAQGRFELFGLRPERTYEVLVGVGAGDPIRARAAIRARANLAIERTLPDVEPVLAITHTRPSALEIELALRRPSHLSFEVRSAVGGAPIEQFAFAIGGGAPASVFDERGEPIRFHANGRVAIDGFRALGDDACTLTIAALGHARQTFPFAWSEGRPLDLGPLLLTPTGARTVIVRDDASSRPIRGAAVVAHEIDGARDAENGLPRAITDDHGVAHVSTFAEPGSRITVEAAGYAPFEIAGPFERGHEAIEARLGGGASVIVHVAAENGDPLAIVEVLAERPDPQSSDAWIAAASPAWTDGSGTGRFDRLAPGLQRIFLGANDRTSDRDITLLTLRSGDTHELWMNAVPTHTLTVTVIDGGIRLAGVPIDLESRDPSGVTPLDASQAVTSSAGSVTYARLRPGAYALTVEIDGSKSSYPIDVLDRDASLAIDVAERALHGIVRTAAGTPAEGAEISIESASGARLEELFDFAVPQQEVAADVARAALRRHDGAGRVLARTLSDANGRFRLRGLSPGAAYVVRATRDGREVGATVVEKFRGGQPITVTIASSGGVEIAARDAGFASDPMLLVLRPAEHVSDVARVLAWNPRTAVALEGLAEGTWWMRAYAAIPGEDALASVVSAREIAISHATVARIEVERP